MSLFSIFFSNQIAIQTHILIAKFSFDITFESSRRDLHNALLCTALQSQFFVKSQQTNIPIKLYLILFIKLSENLADRRVCPGRGLHVEPAAIHRRRRRKQRPRYCTVL